MIEKIGLEHLDDTGKVESRARSIFAEIDSDANGKIDQEELGKAMRNMGVSLSVGELTNMMKEADEDGCAHHSRRPLCIHRGPSAMDPHHGLAPWTSSTMQTPCPRVPSDATPDSSI